MEQVSNVMDILTKLENIENGWMDLEKKVYKDTEKGFKKKYVLSSPEDVLENQVGTCFDIVELERNYFKSLNKKFNAYFMIYYESKKVYTHTFIVYEENDKFYWFEYALTKDKGIHEFISLYDLLKKVRESFREHNAIKFMDNDYLCVYKYKRPKFYIGLKDLYKHCESGENVLI